jgi:hypothetical protein
MMTVVETHVSEITASSNADENQLALVQPGSVLASLAGVELPDHCKAVEHSGVFMLVPTSPDERVAKSGAQTRTFTSKRDFAAAFPAIAALGSAALNKAHYEHKSAIFAQQGALAAVMVADKSAVVASVRHNSKTGVSQIVLHKRAKHDVKARKPAKPVELSDAELIALAAKRGLKLA